MNNVVYIETGKRTGSGVLLKCECENRESICREDEESYIILTNYHVLQDLNNSTSDTNGYVEQKKYVDLEIMDKDGNIIDSKYISHIYFASGNNFDNTSDVAALLVIVKKICDVAYDNSVYFGDEENLLIFSKGYPYVFQDDTINRELCIEGRVEKYSKSGIGIYKILDDYHWYAQKPDKKLFEGLSGAPVYIKEREKNLLLGINQSLCNIGEGMNPFKIVYFLSIKMVLEWLRSQGIILFEYAKESVKIIWLQAGEKDLKAGDEEGKHIVLLGSSGAGKSSFLKAFCLHGKQIDSSGDGQTTRDTAIYKLKKYCQNPNIKIHFRGKKEFKNKNLGRIQFNIIEFVCCERFGMKKQDIIADNMVYLREFSLPLEYLRAHEGFEERIEKVETILKETLYLCESNNDQDDYEDRITKCYGDVFDVFEDFVETGKLENGEREKRLLQLQYILNKDRYKEYTKNQGYGKSKDNSPLKFYKQVFCNGIELVKRCDDSKRVKDFKRIINECNGYFDFKEFFFLNETEDMGQWYETLFDEIFREINWSIEDWRSLEQFISNSKGGSKTDGKKEESTLYGRIEEYYERIYNYIRNELRNLGIDINKEKIIMLEEITKEEADFLAKCLRKKEDASLTSIVKDVVIEDSFSNEYAYMMNRKGINTIYFYDTCGLDHIDRGNQNELYFVDTINSITDETKKKVDAIFYIKKMDSGKPVELEKVIPMIHRNQPDSPIYCIFSGMDQFIEGKEKYIEQMRWNKENYDQAKEFRELLFPKAVGSLYENNAIVRRLQVPDKIRKKIYKFITNNVVPFSAKYKICDDDIIDINRKSLDIIFTSLLIDEWNSGFVNVNKDMIETDQFTEDLKQAVAIDITLMFKSASEYRWENKHHMTVEANYRRIYRFDEQYDVDNPTLGFNRSQTNRWDNLLQKGFMESFLNDGETYSLLVEKGITSEKAYTILTRLRDKILLSGMGRWDETLKKEEEKTKFRKLFEDMYSMEDSPFEWNPFKRYEVRLEELGKNKYIDAKPLQFKIQFLNDVCNFYKGIENEEVLNNFVEYISREITDMLVKENTRCLNLLLNYCPEFKHNFWNIKRILEKYSVDNCTLEACEQIFVAAVKSLYFNDSHVDESN